MRQFRLQLFVAAAAAISSYCYTVEAFLALRSTPLSFARMIWEPSNSLPKPLKSTTSPILAGDTRRDWIDKSLDYYSKVMREERRRSLGQVKDYEEYNKDFLQLAKKHYFALRKIKDGKPQHAEHIYRKIIDELVHEEDGGCDHAKLAVTTLLLALLLQRTGDSKNTRSVFLNFFRTVVAAADDHECACSAKVLQAFALFEMKQGNELKSLEIVLKAVKLDPTLQPVLNWKQFRDVLARRRRQRAERRLQQIKLKLTAVDTAALHR